MAKLSVYSFLCAIVALHGLVGAYQNYKFQKLTPQFRMAKRPLSQTSMMMSPGLSSFVMSDLDVVTSAAGNSLPEFLPSLELSDISATPVAIALGSAFLLFKTFVYWRMQFVSASMVSGIPKGSSVVEIDAQDGKNVFYLPQKVDYTAVMSTGGSGDAKKEKEKSAINNQLILESIGKANRGGLGLSGKVRSRTQDVPSKTADCVLSVGAISRAGDSRVELVNEAFRILKPGGLLVFVEPDGGGRTLSAIQSVSTAVNATQYHAPEPALIILNMFSCCDYFHRCLLNIST